MTIISLYRAARTTCFAALCSALVFAPAYARGHSSSFGHGSSYHSSHSTYRSYSPKTYTTRSSSYYTNSSGHSVHRPIHTSHTPKHWTAQCGDGSYSFSEHRRGTCSHHGGVSNWH